MGQWDIILQCTICGWRSRRHRSDGNPPFGKEPPATVEDVCYNCQSRMHYPVPEVKTTHFVDFARPDEDTE